MRTAPEPHPVGEIAPRAAGAEAPPRATRGAAAARRASPQPSAARAARARAPSSAHSGEQRRARSAGPAGFVVRAVDAASASAARARADGSRPAARARRSAAGVAVGGRRRARRRSAGRVGAGASRPRAAGCGAAATSRPSGAARPAAGWPPARGVAAAPAAPAPPSCRRLRRRRSPLAASRCVALDARSIAASTAGRKVGRVLASMSRRRAASSVACERLTRVVAGVDHPVGAVVVDRPARRVVRPLAAAPAGSAASARDDQRERGPRSGDRARRQAYPRPSAMTPRRMKLLVTGGAGYIGSIVAAQLLDAGHEVTVLDNLSRGHRAAVPAGARARRGRPARRRRDHGARSAGGFDGVLHFAALALVAESVEHPERYYRSNVVGTLQPARRDARGTASSGSCSPPPARPTASPRRSRSARTRRPRPVNAYGDSKLAVDRMIADECRAHGLGAVSLRYFNVAGASGDAGRGPRARDAPDPARPAGRRRPARARLDLRHRLPDAATAPRCATTSTSRTSADAHLLALDAHRSPARTRIYNLGNGDGYSVREVIEAARARDRPRDPASQEEPRRAGDPPQLVAASEQIRDELGWEPRAATSRR